MKIFYIFRIIAAMLVAVCFSKAAAYAAVVRVPADQPTIQEAVNEAHDGDTVIVFDGTWSGRLNKDLTWYGSIKHITVKSANGPENCIIDCENDGRGFDFNETAQDATDVIEGLTIRNAYYVISPIEGDGGGIYCNAASPNIVNCIFTGNSAGERGGGIYCGSGSSPAISDCIFMDNFAATGAGIMCDDSSPTISGCSFTGNDAYPDSGALFCGINSSPLITDCYFSENTGCGGIRCYGENSCPQISSCSFTGNSTHYGGAINVIAAASPAIIGCSFAGNMADVDGGAVYCSESSSPVIIACEFTGNRATGFGGGICCSDSFPVIGGSLENGNYFAGNEAGRACDIYSGDAPQTPFNARYNTFEGFHLSEYYVSRTESFDLAGCVSEMLPITQDIYVSIDGDDGNEGTSEDSPFLTVQRALSAAYGTESTPIVIRVSPGTYSTSATGERFPLPALDYVSLKGDRMNDVILDAEYNRRVVHSEYNEGVYLSGLTIFRGYSGDCVAGNEGGGIYCYRTSLTITDCNLSNNFSVWHGGGIYCEHSSPDIMNCIFSFNQSESRGGGIYCIQSSPPILNCTFTGNTSADPGGGIALQVASPLVMNCILWNDYPDELYATGAHPFIYFNDIQGGYYYGGNINSDPYFAEGPDGDYYLSRRDAGQDEDSPCVNSGADLSALTCFELPCRTVCQDDLTTRTDEIADTGRVDMGFHYAPVNSPTAHPDLSPTPAAAEYDHVELEMPDHYFSPGDVCSLTAHLHHYSSPASDVLLFIILDISGQYWFWDDWSHEPDWNRTYAGRGITTIPVIQAFDWPDTGEESAEGIKFWGAMMNEDMTEVSGGSEGIGQWVFGFGL